MAKVDVLQLIKDIYIMTMYDEPTDFHGTESDISFIAKTTETSFHAEDVLRKCNMNACNECLSELTMAVAIGDGGYFLERKKCELCGMIAWREPMEKICSSCCDMNNLCGICWFSPRLPIKKENMPQAIMNGFVNSKLETFSKHRQALVFKAISHRWREFYINKKITAEQATIEIEVIVKYFSEKPEPKFLL